MSSTRIMPVLNQLYAGKRVKLRFDSADIRESFRQAIYKLKKTQDDALYAVDMQEERLVLKYDPDETIVQVDEFDQTYIYFATFWLDKKKEISFEIISVEENPVKVEDGGNQAKVPAGLGEVDSQPLKTITDSDLKFDNDASNPQGNIQREGLG